jgi:nicotinamidase-related amidase
MDVCVQATAEDALRDGFKVIVVREAVKGVNDGASELAIQQLQEAGAKIYNTTKDLARRLQVTM